MPVEVITSYSQFKEVISGGTPCIIDFWATWCGPCKAISPVLEQLSNKPEFKDLIRFFKVDVDDLEDVASEVQVRAMPTFMSFVNGNKIDELVGGHPAKLQAFLVATAEEAVKLKSQN